LNSALLDGHLIVANMNQSRIEDALRLLNLSLPFLEIGPAIFLETKSTESAVSGKTVLNFDDLASPEYHFNTWRLLMRSLS
jgi:hypothetical protein